MPASNFLDKLQRYAPFSAIERREFWLAIFILGFVTSWNKWGSVEFDFWVGLGNLVISFLFATVILSTHHFAQRWWGLSQGLKVEHKIWWYGAGIALVTSILSQGSFVILALSGTYISALTAHRLGRYRYGAQIKDFAMIALIGPVAVIVIAGIVKSLQIYTNLPLPELWVNQFFVTSIAFAAWNLLPIPPLDGSRIIFSSRLLYAFVIGGVLGYAFLLSAGIYSWLWAMVIGLATMCLFYFSLENGWV